MMRLKRFSRLSATLAMAAVLAPLSTVIMPTTATATSALTIWATSGANYDWQKTLIPGFERATGIHVTYDVLPETPLLDREETAEIAHSTAYSVMEYSQAYSSTFAAEHGAAPLKTFLDNPKLTPVSYDFKGISPGLYAACEVNGQLYCLPMSGDGGQKSSGTRLFSTQQESPHRPPPGPRSSRTPQRSQTPRPEFPVSATVARKMTTTIISS